MAEPAENVLPPDPGRKIALAALFGLIAGYVLFNVLVYLVVSFVDRPTAFALVLLGGLAAEPILFGVWAAMGPGSFLLRLPFVIAALGVVIISFGLSLQWLGHGDDSVCYARDFWDERAVRRLAEG